MKITLAALASTGMAHSSNDLAWVNATKPANCLRKNAEFSRLPALVVAFDFGAQPGPRVSPEPVSACPRLAEEFPRLVDRQPGEEMQLDELGGRRVFERQPAERCVERDQVAGLPVEGDAGIEIDPPAVPAVLTALLPARIVHQNSPH